MADRIAARCDHAQMASKTCQESARPPVQGGRPSSCLRRGVGRYSIKFTDHGWHHEPHSPVKTSCVESGTHPCQAVMVLRVVAEEGRTATSCAQSMLKSLPNNDLQATANSVRSYLAPAVRRA